MEEINLDLESSSHKSISLNSTPSNSNLPTMSNNISLFKDEPPKESNIGIDLLINKNKTSGGSQPPITEFKPSEPVVNKDSIQQNNMNITLKDIGSPSSTPRNSFSSEPVTSINMNNEKKIDNLDLNLDDLFKDDNKPSATTNILDEPVKISLDGSNISSTAPISTEPKKTYEELQKEKAEYIRLLERLELKGLNSHKKFNMNSDYAEVKAEFDRLTRRRECDQSVKFQRKMLIAFVTAVEFLNTKFDPFDVKLEGWSESVHENSHDYDDVFEELHEKYQSKSKMAPELKLLFMLGGSGFMFHLTNTMFKSSLPGMGDIMKQNPDLARQFAQATASSMGNSQPGFSNFMGGLFGGGGGGQQAQQQAQQMPRKEMDGPPNINDILNNMNPNKVDIDLNSNYSESDMESTRNININRNKKSLNLDI
jgi:hypothetical protein